MSKLMLVMTAVLLGIPIFFLAISKILWLPAILMLLIYAGVWFIGRPTRFEISPDVLRIVWPIRSRAIPRSDIARVRLLNKAEIKQEMKWGMRVGAGGLWGGFGRAITDRGWMELWVSREDWCVFVERKHGIPLILTPDRPQEFVEVLS